MMLMFGEVSVKKTSCVLVWIFLVNLIGTLNFSTNLGLVATAATTVETTTLYAEDFESYNTVSDLTDWTFKTFEPSVSAAPVELAVSANASLNKYLKVNTGSNAYVEFTPVRINNAVNPQDAPDGL